MIAIQPQSRQLLGVNQQAYQSLKAAMSLNLRRQLLIAVCDSAAMQTQLATQLQHDLASGSAIASTTAAIPAGERADTGGARNTARDSAKDKGLDEWSQISSLADLSRQGRSLKQLQFDPEDGNLPKQVARWIQQTMLAEGVPGLQVLGIEQMTQQPAITQNHFLRSLEKVEALLPRLNTSLLVWVTWPWLRTIQQSAPTFWNWRSGVFEFVSDPTPPRQEQLPVGEPAALELDRELDHELDREAHTWSASALSTDSDTSLYQAASNLYGEIDGEVDGEASDSDLILTVAVEPLQHDRHSLNRDALSEAVKTEDVKATAGPDDLIGRPNRETSNPDLTEIGNPDMDRRIITTAGSKAAGGLHSIVSKGINASARTADRSEDSAVGPVEGALSSSVGLAGEQKAGEQKTGEQETGGQKAEEQKAGGRKEREGSSRRKTADDYFAVGYVYRNRIEAGERGLALIEPAIAAYEGGLRCLSRPYPLPYAEWSSSLNDLGTLYWLKAQQLTDPQQSVDCMTHSITLYQEALTRTDPQQPSSLAEQLYSNIGAVYSLLATYEEPVDYLEQAAIAYSQALELSSEGVQEDAILQNSLGSVYWKLSHYDSAQPNLYRAITAYKAASAGYRSDQQPLDYAAVQNNLGISYWSLAKHEQTQGLLKQAIAAYSDALKYRTPEVDPAACATTYNNLALAYWDLSKTGDLYLDQKLRYQRNAIIAFEAALNISQATDTLSKMDSAAIYHCLGDVHAQMAETAPSLPEIAESLQKSLYSYLQAIDGLAAGSPAYQGRLAAIITNLRAHYNQLGLAGQQAALNTVPPALLSQVMMSL